MKFEEALKSVKEGKEIYCGSWNGLGKLSMGVKLQNPDEHSKMTLPYLYMECRDLENGYLVSRVAWIPSQKDLFAEDWFEINDMSA